MSKECRLSCKLCTAPPGAPKVRREGCSDTNSNCATWASIGECDTNPSFMKVQCPLTCRLCQSDKCRDYSDDCPTRATGQGCYTDVSMRKECAWSCLACDLAQKPACARPRDLKPAAWPGSGDAMFERLVASRPDVTVHSRSPWVVTIDDFLTHEEADALLKAGAPTPESFQRSQAGDGVLAARTSSTAWCKGRCNEEPNMVAVMERIQQATSVPMQNSEYLQVLRYEEGQFYKTHHDQNSPRSSAWGPRLYTFFMYLSDHEDTALVGGETRFPLLNITVPPKKGRALFWTSVESDDPCARARAQPLPFARCRLLPPHSRRYQRDDRTDHEALPVISGIKYAANYWLHMFPFREPSTKGCSNIAYADNWF